MPNRLHHERIARGTDLAKLESLRVTLCGAGTVGSVLADGLARSGANQLTVIDDDRVEEHNVGPQLYGLADVGLLKVDALRNRIFADVQVEITTLRKRFTAGSARRLVRNSDLVIDAFDNTASRWCVKSICEKEKLSCLHVGLADGYGEVIWNPEYQVPESQPTDRDPCDYPLTRSIAMLTVCVAIETIFEFLRSGETRNRSITLGDLSVRELTSVGNHADAAHPR